MSLRHSTGSAPATSGVRPPGRGHSRQWLGAPLVLAFLIAGCAHLPGGKDDGAGVGWKRVFEKAAPSYLVAVDRTECVVSAKRFAEVEVGDNVFCAWSRGGLAGDRFDDGGAIERRAAPDVRREASAGGDTAGRVPPGN